MQEYETYEKGNQKLKIYYDELAENPRDWDNVATFAMFHKRYSLPNETDLKTDMFGSWEEMKQYIIKEMGVVAILPIYMYDHSGVALSTESFIGKAHHAEWDSGQVGFAFITKQRLKEEGIDEARAEKIIESEVETYGAYLTGEVFGFELVEVKVCSEGDEHEEVKDSCWGFFGTDFKENGLFEQAGVDPKEWSKVVMRY